MAQVRITIVFMMFPDVKVYIFLEGMVEVVNR